MTTYNSYESAKIANPDRDVFTNTANDKFQSKSDESFFIRCLPSHHCMTVEKFLADGHKFVEGDLIYSSPLSKVIVVSNVGEFGASYPTDGANNSMPSDNVRFILRAAALETKEPKRTKIEYVKRNYSTAWQAAKDHEERVEFLYRQSDLGEAIKGNNWKAIQSPSEAAQYHFDLYRRVETPIEWWEDASEFINQTDDDNCSSIMEGKLHVNATLTQDQWCDFARILLEQGE